MSKAAELANLIGNINAGGGGANKNVIINGNMSCSQRSTSATGKGDADGYFTCDRWHIDVGDTSAGRFTMSQDSSAPDGFANSLKIATTTADTSIAAGEKLVLQTKIEGQNAQTFAKGTSSAKPMALSFYVKGNASATYVAEIFDENDRQCSKTFNVTTDWTRIKLSFPADTTGTLDDDNATSLFVNFHLHAGSNFTSGTLNSSSFASSTNANRAVGISSIFDSTSRTFFLTGVQLEVGQNPTSFEHEPFERTFKKCQRYYQRVNADAAFDYGGIAIAVGTNSRWYAPFYLDGPMRTDVTLSFSAVANFRTTLQHSDSVEVTSLSIGYQHDDRPMLSISAGSNSAGALRLFGFNGASAGFIAFDAEL